MAGIPSYNNVLGTQNAAHLLRRATLGATKQQIDQFAQLTAPAAMARLLKMNPLPPPPVDPATGQSWVNPKPTEANSNSGDLENQLNSWWTHQMAAQPLSVHEKMTFFLHTHFTTISNRVEQKPALYHQLRLFHHYAIGNIKSLARKICTDNAMLRFLDGHLNDVGNVNENFGREFLELYSVGKGPQIGANNYTTYTEEDVQAAAKVFSGWKQDKEFATIDAETGAAQAILKGDNQGIADRHDASTKQFSAAFQNQTISPNALVGDKATQAAAAEEIDQLVEMVFAQPATARHLCRKLYRYFVYYEITDEVEQTVIEPLAQFFMSNNYELQPVLTALLTSQHFYDNDNAVVEDDNTGAIIKSPLELIIGTLRFFQTTLPNPSGNLELHYRAYHKVVLKGLTDQGLYLYEPFEVAGYPAYHQGPSYHRNWISANYLARRYEFAKKLIEGVRDEEQLLAHLDVVAYVKDKNNISDPFDAERLVRELTDYLLPEAITEERFTYFLKSILLDDLSEANWQTEWQNYLGSGNDAAVRVQLEKLFNTVLQSPEYQLS
ncbi:MAG: DUF1800 domain-containing protein [Tunicatimonas sp.]